MGAEIRLETPADFLEIREINRMAFKGDAEANLIEALREEGSVTLSMVAQHEDGMLLGHILYSDLGLVSDGGTPLRAVALAPMSVRDHVQGQWIGSQLIYESLPVLKDLGVQVVVVLGHPGFYQKFGFRSGLAEKHLKGPFSGEAFMALELEEGCLQGTYKVHYAKAFGL